MTTFTQVLDYLGNNLVLHGKFLNTLSLLEYIGSRKIIKSQVDRKISYELLGHISEEIRHALVLKSIALKLSEQQLTTYEDEHLLCGNNGKYYIQTIDYSVEKFLNNKHLVHSDHENEPFNTIEKNISPTTSRHFNPNSWINYLITTLLIEERASLVYPEYNQFLTNLGIPNKLTSIIRDENYHLEVVTRQVEIAGVNIKSLLDPLRAIEVRAFNQFLQAILTSQK